MKKRLCRIVALTLALAALLSGVAALAGSGFGCGDLVVKRAKAYADASMKHYIGTIPANTAVMLEFYNDAWKPYYTQKVARVLYRGIPCYIRSSCLMNDKYKMGLEISLPKGTRVYQRPSLASSHKTLRSKKRVFYQSMKGGWVLVRTTGTDYNGYYGFVYIGG